MIHVHVKYKHKISCAAGLDQPAAHINPLTDINSDAYDASLVSILLI